MTATGPGVAPQLALGANQTSAGRAAAFGSTTPAVAAAPTAPTPPPANPYQQYLDAYNASLGQQRGQLDQQLLQSASALGARRDAAAGVVAQLPGQIQSAWGAANGGQQGSADAIQGALPPDMKGVAAWENAPNKANLAADESAAGSAAPFLDLAMRANYDSGNAALQQAHLTGEMGLEQQAQAAQLQTAHDLAQQQMTQAWAQNPNNPDSITGRVAINKQETASAADAQPAPGAAGNLGLTKGDTATLQKDPAYGRWTTYIHNQPSDAKNNAGVAAQIIAELGTKNPKLLALLRAENPDFFKAPAAFKENNPDGGLAASLDLHGSPLGHAINKVNSYLPGGNSNLKTNY